MADIRIAGVMRAGAYSPNHIGNDAAIFNLTAEALRKRGVEVNVFSEEEFLKADIEAPVVMAMCREQESIAKLKKLEDEGRLVINSGYGIENCTRERMTRLLVGNGVPYPESLIVDTNENIKGSMQRGEYDKVWIKRGDSHSKHKEDVSYCRHPEEAQEVLHEYFYRGIKRAVINKHLPGDLIKFYGIVGSDFFYHFYPMDFGHSKYGYELINGMATQIPYDEAYLKQICGKAAEVLGVKVYGGDCIVDPDGSIRIIDLNDWPSFAPCRKEGSIEIAKTILSEIRKR